MTATMQAGVASETGLQIREIARPSPGPGQVLVRVKAAGMNRADLNAARGAGVATKESLSKPIGMEWSGEVVETGDGASGFKPGDLVMCSGTGGYAQYAVSDAARTIRLRDGMDLKQAAVLPLALMTAHDALITHGGLEAGQSVLVQGASSAVGLMTLQIARWRGAKTVAGTSTNPGKRSRLQTFGATNVYDPADQSWPDALHAVAGKGVDVVIDMVGGPSVTASLKALKVLGRMVNVGRLGGTKAEFDFDLHAAKRITYIGVTFRTRTPAEVADIVARMRSDLWDAVASGDLGLPIDRSFDLARAAEAHAHMAANGHFGKIVLIP